MKKYCAGIDIGGTNSVIGLVDGQGNCVCDRTISTKDFETPEAFVKAACIEIRHCLEQNKDAQLSGIGIGAPNGNYYTGCIEFAPNLPWKGVIKLAELFRQETGTTSVLTNDANAAAVGEQLFGAAKGMKNFVVITLGTGLGSGFVINGEVLYGHDGFAGELGHVIVVRDGRLCGCGRRGCLETYASATGIVRTMHEWLDNSAQPSPLRNLEEITSRQIAEQGTAGDPIALEVVDYTAKILGRALADMVCITSPQAIFLFGGLAQAGDLLIKPVKKYMEENLLNIFKNKIEIYSSKLSSNAAVLGAGALAWKHT
ncbi:MAG: glucokinase [Bacteroidetes bacterium]|nr:MAG: glucokinase [Bacteroidota bacterium]